MLTRLLHSFFITLPSVLSKHATHAKAAPHPLIRAITLSPKAGKPHSTGQRKRKREKSHSKPLDEFFAKYYPKFKYDPTRSASLEFDRLCDTFGWGRFDPERENAHKEFKNALVWQFNRLYGTDENDLANWQNLCYIIRIDPVPQNLRACRGAVRRAHVNLVDLVDTGTTGEEVEVFDSELKLSEYTIEHEKFFPRKNAHAGGLLRYLLRHIHNPETKVRSRRH